MVSSLHDMHCHLDFMPNAEEVAAEAEAAGTLLFANTVTPEGWAQARARFASFGNVHVGFGMHPWWVAGNGAADLAADLAAAPAADAASDDARASVRGESQRARHRRLEAQATLAPRAPRADSRSAASVTSALDEHDPALVGEVGLDFGWRHAGSRAEQMAMFSAIARWAARRGGKLVSLHSIRAARETLDILEQAGALETCTCVFHWFSGPADQLKRAIGAGCYFSCGTRMLATKKGREYVRVIPADRLLLETDAPPEQGMSCTFEEMRSTLEQAAAQIAAIKGPEALEAISLAPERLLKP